MDKKRLTQQLLRDIEKYPLPLRVAAQLKAANVTEEDLAGFIKIGVGVMATVSDPTKLAVQNALRDLCRKQSGLTGGELIYLNSISVPDAGPDGY